jgi:hypothetical protein
MSTIVNGNNIEKLMLLQEDLIKAYKKTERRQCTMRRRNQQRHHSTTSHRPHLEGAIHESRGGRRADGVGPPGGCAMRPNTRMMLLAACFLLPNFAGFAVFTLGPVLFSFVASFTNWNLMHTVPFRFVGLDNYIALVQDPRFWLYFVNTVYFMLGMPIAIAGSLFLADVEHGCAA